MINTISGIKIQKFSPNLGAIITDVDLSKGVNDDQFKDIEKAFLEYQVLFFQNQNEISPELHLKFGKLFGELHMHPAAPSMNGYPEIFEIHAHKDSKVANGEFWHSDVSCDITPPLGTMLQLHILPETGGDTMFSNMYAAYNELSDKYKTLLDGLIAIHESEHLYKGRYEIELYTIPGVSFKVPIRVNLQYRKEQEYKIDDCIAQLIVRHKKEKESGVYISEDFVHRVG